MKYKVGQLVVNSSLGIGKVLEVQGEIVTCCFKDQRENPRRINVAVVPMKVAERQSDSGFDDFGPAKRSKAGWTIKRKSNTSRTPQPRKTK